MLKKESRTKVYIAHKKQQKQKNTKTKTSNITKTQVKTANIIRYNKNFTEPEHTKYRTDNIHITHKRIKTNREGRTSGWKRD